MGAQCAELSCACSSAGTSIAPRQQMQLTATVRKKKNVLLYEYCTWLLSFFFFLKCAALSCACSSAGTSIASRQQMQLTATVSQKNLSAHCHCEIYVYMHMYAYVCVSIYTCAYVCTYI